METHFHKVGTRKSGFMEPRLEDIYQAARSGDKVAFVALCRERTLANYTTAKRRYWLKLATYITVISVTLTAALIILAEMV